MNITKKCNILAGITLASVAFINWIAWSNTALMTHNITIGSNRLPQAFHGFRIAHISDLHNTEFGTDNKHLLRKIKKAHPDMIVITGDLIDSRRTNPAIALALTTKLCEIAPTYYVTGNHEIRIYNTFQQMETKMQDTGVHILHREAVWIERNGQSIQLIGMDDPTYYADETFYEHNKLMFARDLHALKTEDVYTILLSHRPELFRIYETSDIDLICSGHAHGGQFRLPFLGGLYMPGQGVFPKYDAGLFTKNHTTMVVSRGIGNSSFPFRLNNRPELIVIELQCQK